jgi:hypothetical protein
METSKVRRMARERLFLMVGLDWIGFNSILVAELTLLFLL